MNKLCYFIFTRIPRKLCHVLFHSVSRRYIFEVELERVAGHFHSLLDVGCGARSPIKKFSAGMYTVGIDLFEPSIEQSKKDGIHDKYFLMNMLDIDKEFTSLSFECVLSCDTLEHLTKKEGVQLLEKMEKIAQKRVVVFTPNGFVHQDPYENNYLQIHKSGWTVGDMRERGYIVIGINGWKPLRSEGALIRFQPAYLWETISSITQILFARRFPKTAFQMLCIKDIRK